MWVSMTVNGQKPFDPRIETLTIVIPELFHPQTMSKIQRMDKVRTVLLRRVLVRLMNIG